MTIPVRRPLSRLAAAPMLAAALAFISVAVGAPAAPATGAERAPGPAGAPLGLGLQEVLSDYDAPVFVTGVADLRLFIVEQTGRIRVATRSSTDSPWVKAGVFLNVTSRISIDSERGLLGLAFHPNYASNKRFYIFYTRAGDGRLMVDEYRRDTALKADPASRRQVLGIGHPEFANHNGGWMAFGPDKRLYIAAGDGGSGGDPDENAQNLDLRLGKILRIDPLDPDGSGPLRYAIPGDNPFVGVDGNDAVWTYGLRNPWRNSFDRLTGDLWIGDVGESTYEEVNHHQAPNAGRGLNDGWDLCEGDHVSEGSGADCGPPPTSTVRPVAEYQQEAGDQDNCAVTGGYVYRGSDHPALYGTYVFADFCSGRVWAIPTDFDLADGDTLPAPVDTPHLISSFGEDADGELYAVSLSGSILRVVVAD